MPVTSRSRPVPLARSRARTADGVVLTSTFSYPSRRVGPSPPRRRRWVRRRGTPGMLGTGYTLGTVGKLDTVGRVGTADQPGTLAAWGMLTA